MSETKTIERWIITGQFQLITPMHIGTGLDEKMKKLHDEKTDKKDENPWIQAIALDQNNNPYIPGASLKGALKALSARYQCTRNLNIFGDTIDVKDQNNNKKHITIAGQAEFCNAWYAADQEEKPFETVTRIAIDRVTGTAEDKKLFNIRRVNPGTCFDYRIIVQNTNESEIKVLLGLLRQIAKDPKFTLGAGANQTQGKIRCLSSCVRYFGKQQAHDWFQAIKQGKQESWHVYAKPCDVDLIELEQSKNITITLELPLKLNFHTPFLVKTAGNKEKYEADAKPHTDHNGHAILPASSLRGRLRAQAERVLRTLCPDLDIQQGHKATPYNGKAHDDIISLLFGTAGWRGIIRTRDCRTLNSLTEEKVKRQEMVAIDRFTGGSKDGAKFNVDYVECPTLKGTIYLDIHRLKQAKLKNSEDALKPALGLISLLLRDLAEGDIPFGFGISKGYGQCREQKVLQKWQEQLKNIETDNEKKLSENKKVLSVNDTLEALRTYLSDNIKPDNFETLLDNLYSSSSNKTGSATSNTELNQDTEATNESDCDSDDKFHNPYHFIPLNEPNIYCWPEADSKVLKDNKHGHDQYHTDKFSGRIVCRLTTKTPLFIGAETNHSDEDYHPSETKPFKLNGQHALPATSLRGMLSSLFESVSSSNFRVLHPEKYSVRKPAKGGALSAMGRITSSEDGKLKLQPLTLPTLNQDTNQLDCYKIPEKWLGVFKDKTPLRIYFHPSHPGYTSNEIYVMRPNEIPSNGSRICVSQTDDNIFRFPDGDNCKKFLIGLRNQGPMPRHPDDILNLPEEKKKKFKCGWIRTLIDSCRDLPREVKHHVFLPDTSGEIDSLDIPNDVITRFNELADLALAGMQPKPNEETNDLQIFPYTPIGRNQEGNRPSEDHIYIPRFGTRLKHGDLVFFDVKKEKEIISISEISFSSIWRQGIERDGELLTSANLLTNSNSDLLPYGMLNRCKKLSPAERLFGVVEDRESKKYDKPGNASKDDQAFSYAGKVRIGFGIPSSDNGVSTESPVILKELSSPKPPSPALYLKPKSSNCYRSKAEIANQGNTIVLRGRKYYLHSLRNVNQSVLKLNNKGEYKKINNSSAVNDENFKAPWETLKEKTNDPTKFKNESNKYINKRQVRIEPIHKGNDFYFEIDFNNLDQTELAQLSATLQPTPEFEHRLGMGKPLGLGSVKIEPIGLFLINRHQRYAAEGIDCERYHRIWLKDDQVDKDWPDYLKQHKQSIYCEETFNNEFGKLVRSGLDTITNADIKSALKLFGDPKNINLPVHYPLAQNGTMENEGFIWFVNNDRTNELKNNPKYIATPRKPQYLHSITKDSETIQPLAKNKIEKIDNQN